MAAQAEIMRNIKHTYRAPNLMPFAPFDGLPPLQQLDQTMMMRLRELADRRDLSVENLIHEALGQWLARCEVEREPEAKDC
jgi:hypothetical protein